MEQLRYLEVLNDTAAVVAASDSVREALGRTVELVARRLGLDVCSIYLFDAEVEELVLAASHGLLPDSIGKVSMGLEEGLTGLVGKTQRPLFTSSAQEHPQFKFFPQTGEERFTSFGGIPLLRHGKLEGVLTVQTARQYEFGANEQLMLATLGGLVVSIIDVSELLARSEAPPSEERALCLTGLGTSPGIGMARAVVMGVRAENLPPPAQESLCAAEELERFEEALAESFEEADRMIASLREAGAGGEAVEILQAHRTLLGDPHFVDTVRQLISQEQQGASAAVINAISPTIEAFSKIEVLQEKSHDLIDIRTQLLAHLGLSVESEIIGDEPVVVMAQTLTPAQTATLDPDTVVAVVTEHGSETSHMSILARSRGIPAVVGVAGLLEKIRRGDTLLVDGHNGFVFVNPDERTCTGYFERKEQEEAAHQAIVKNVERYDAGGGVTPHQVEINLGFSGEVQQAIDSGAQSVGLLRTEFFYMQRSAWPTVSEQTAYYKRIFAAFEGGAVTVRLVDIGGDKKLPFMEELDEPNPILGLRSVRWLLEHPDIYRTQLSAVIGAADVSPGTTVRIMVPMVTSLWEMRAAREIYTEVRKQSGSSRQLPFGMMVEVPAVLYQLEDYLPVADFFSIGSNDLVQYMMAVDRNNERVRDRYVPHHPAVLHALYGVVTQLRRHWRVPSVCGEMASMPATALALMALGFERFSVLPRNYPLIRYLSQSVVAENLDVLRQELLAQDNADAVAWLLREKLREHADLLARI